MNHEADAPCWSRHSVSKGIVWGGVAQSRCTAQWQRQGRPPHPPTPRAARAADARRSPARRQPSLALPTLHSHRPHKSGRTKAARRGAGPAADRPPAAPVAPSRRRHYAVAGPTAHAPVGAVAVGGGEHVPRAATRSAGEGRPPRLWPPPPPHTPPEGERPRPAPPIRTPSGSRPHAFVQPSISRIGRRGESPILIDTHTHN